jgi:hypothetical protein
LGVWHLQPRRQDYPAPIYIYSAHTHTQWWKKKNIKRD